MDLIFETAFISRLSQNFLIMENQNTTDLINQLSDEFSRLIVEAFTADQLAETIAKNHTAEYAGLCATHDYCDANMVMDEAFINIIGRDYIFFDDEHPETEEQNKQDVALENAAWGLSKSKDFARCAVPAKD